MTRMEAEATAFERNRKAPKGVNHYAVNEDNNWIVKIHESKANGRKN